jgi:hypothetical protein
MKVAASVFLLLLSVSCFAQKLKTNCLIPLLLLVFASCSNLQSSTEVLENPKNIDKKAKWLIDEPWIIGGSTYLEEFTVNHYKLYMKHDFGTVASLSEFRNIATMKQVIVQDPQVMLIYKEQTGYDYLIETKVRLTKDDMPAFQAEPNEGLSKGLVIDITVYDLNRKEICFRKTYRYSDSAELKILPVAFGYKSDKFIENAVQQATKSFSNARTWKVK